jgi:hypothetical protein
MAISERQPLAMIVACQVVETLPNIMLDLLIVSPTDDQGNASLKLSDLEIFA